MTWPLSLKHESCTESRQGPARCLEVLSGVQGPLLLPRPHPQESHVARSGEGATRGCEMGHTCKRWHTDPPFSPFFCTSQRPRGLSANQGQSRPEYKSPPGGLLPRAECVGREVNLGWEFKVSPHCCLPILSSPTPKRVPREAAMCGHRTSNCDPVAVTGRPRPRGWEGSPVTTWEQQNRAPSALLTWPETGALSVAVGTTGWSATCRAAPGDAVCTGRPAGGGEAPRGPERDACPAVGGP